MGITGLLPFLEKSSKRTNVREFTGNAVAIDSYCWLHKGVFSCAEKLMMGQTTNAYVLYCMKYIDMLLKYKIKPILVFDGRRLPAKEHTEIKRRQNRQINRQKAIELIQMGQVAEGKNLLKRAIDITHEIALELIKHCQKENIDCIVAPYEADAQLAYLNISGIADVVITEDSDLTLFGCKKIFFKMDFNGNGILIEQDRLHLAMNIRPEEFNMDKFRYTCILSGCDYLPSLPGIGLAKARKFIARNTDHNIHRALTRIGSVLNMKSLVVTQEYRDAFILADITFKHQLVFCPLQRKQIRLNPPTDDITEDQLQYAGKKLDADLALQLALGNCDPSTLKIVHDFNPDKIERKRKRDTEAEQTLTIHISIWSSKYKLKTEKNVLFSKNAVNSSIIAKKELALQRNFLNNEHTSTEFHNSQIVPCNRLLECQDSNENAILNMYNSSQDVNLISSPKKKAEEYLCFAENNTSPELFKSKNPFVKRVSDLTTSPSILSDGNCRRKGKNLMRIRRTIIDENIIVESKYFSKQINENIYELENKRIDVDLKNMECNIIPETSDSIYNTRANTQPLDHKLETLSIAVHPETANSIKDISDTLLSDQNEYLTNTCEDVSEKSYFNNLTENSHCTTIAKDYGLDKFSLSSSNIEAANNSINYGNTNNLQDNLSECSNIKDSQVSSQKKEIFKKRSSVNLVPRVNSITKKKQLRQNKQLSVPKQQSLLSMFGFQKR
ncbi:exonuclease 1 isoform X1 [Cataglyphis hispanica]|uniref:exonuclease 1 isoform X1 n=1 Tax=Cataglyphis hispanica TaxID=1086592 RepID=UPI00217FFB4D|nr:exonuclease 1 isoform X1 [Cataglyphis hispanica]